MTIVYSDYTILRLYYNITIYAMTILYYNMTLLYSGYTMTNKFYNILSIRMSNAKIFT